MENPPQLNHQRNPSRQPTWPFLLIDSSILHEWITVYTITHQLSVKKKSSFDFTLCPWLIVTLLVLDPIILSFCWWVPPFVRLRTVLYRRREISLSIDHPSLIRKFIDSPILHQFSINSPSTLLSMDWFKGKFTGNHRFYHEILCFPAFFSLKPIHWSFRLYHLTWDKAPVSTTTAGAAGSGATHGQRAVLRCKMVLGGWTERPGVPFKIVT